MGCSAPVACCILVLLSACWTQGLKFPPGFMFGAASSAYQVEGAWNECDKGESIWDYTVHTRKGFIGDGSTGDVSCDSYHQYRQDVRLLVELGVHHYRFSLSWTRLLPQGSPNSISEIGTRYYNNLINELIANGIEPVVTLYHWDLPQRLQELGGWTSPLVSDWFADYARVAYALFADRVNTWLTFNEPAIACDLGYNTGVLAPGQKDPNFSNYLCSKFVLMAHAKAWRIYDEEFKPLYHGRVAIANHASWHEGRTPADRPLAQLVNEYMAGRFSDPIYLKSGGWPPAIEKIIAEKSKKEGHPRSRLPAFTKAEREFVRGTYDFYALNHYTSRVVRKAHPGEQLQHFPAGDAPELNAKLEIRPDWKYGASAFFPIYAKGLRNVIRWLNNRYGNVSIFITENGYSTSAIGLDDDLRVEYINAYLEQVQLAITEDGADVTGYTYWSLLDNFEWMDGYQTKFGLYEVNFEDPRRTRTARKSAHYYASIIKQNSLDVPLTPATWLQMLRKTGNTQNYELNLTSNYLNFENELDIL